MADVIDANDAKIQFFMALAAGRRVLDLGVVQHSSYRYLSPRWLHRAVRRASQECIGLDIDEDGIRSLQAQGYAVHVGDAQAFDLGRTFDLIVAGDIIEHLSNVGSFLDCARRHLQPQGILAITTPNPFWWKTWLQVALLGRPVVHAQHTAWLCSVTLTQVLERHGFRVQSLHFDSIYELSKPLQKVTKLITTVAPFPARIRHNTIFVTAMRT